MFYVTWKDGGIVFVGSLRNSGVHGVHQKVDGHFDQEIFGGTKVCIRLPRKLRDKKHVIGL